jgi:glycosyltransferase involved in cell wall biosynthesis
VNGAAGPAGPIRVCFVNFYAYPLFNPAAGVSFGGAELQLATMATELARDPGFAVSFLVREAGQPPGEVREGVAIHGFAPPGLGAPFTGEARHLRALWGQLREIDPEIVIQRAAGTLTGEIALFCALRRRAFIYMVAHDSDLGGSRPPWWDPGPRGAVNWALYRLGLRLAARVVVQHGGQAALLRTRYGKEGIVRPCVQRLPGPQAPQRERFILWVARAEPWKQPERFLELARAFPQERFVMICPPAESDPGLFRRVREEAALLPNLEFRDFVPYPEIEGFFARALLFVNTSRSEGFPNTFVHAWKHGTPVLSLAVDPEGAILEHGLGAVCGGEPARLHGALAALLGDPARREACSRSALAWARSRHDVRVQIEVDKAHLRAVWKERFGRRG